MEKITLEYDELGLLIQEVWKSIPGYEGLYKASNYGRILSLARCLPNSKGSGKYCRERLLKQTLKPSGYLSTYLFNDSSVKKYYRVNRLIMFVFKGPSPLTVDHFNRIKTDNKIWNLRYCTGRENVLYYTESRIKTSQFPGVCWHKKS